MSNLGTMIGIYSILTIGYIAIKYVKTKKDSFSETFTMIYLMAVMVFSFVTNLQTTNKLCGNNDYTTAIMVTVIPWSIILGVLLVLLKSFPGWKSPFSNTFGYLVAKLMGVGKILLEITPGGKSSEIYQLCKKKVSTVVNVHSWPSVKDNPLKLDINGSEKAKLWTQFTHIVLMKDLIGEMLWYLLAGFLIISYQSSYIVNNSCPAKVDSEGVEIKPDPASADEKKTIAKY